MSAPLLLIVEDELAIQELIVFVCEAEGFRTTRAGSIAEARSALAAERPDLILLDRMLPDRPGEEWLRELRSDAKTADVPVIILTARGNESDRVAGLDAGADDYVVKPFSLLEVLARQANRSSFLPKNLSSSPFLRPSLGASFRVQICLMQCGRALLLTNARWTCTCCV